MEKKLLVSSSPHFKSDLTVNKIMRHVIIALIPVLIASVYFFGLRALFIIAVTTLSTVLTEHIVCLIQKKKSTIKDGSAVITGILLAMVLPPSFPWWMAVIGGFVAIVLGKAVFGGLGYNIFNPALVGRAFLQAAYPTAITTWSKIADWSKGVSMQLDAVSVSTPLAHIKSQMTNVSKGTLESISLEPYSYLELFLGKIPGCIGETSAIAILIGAIYLFYKKVLEWRIPTFYIGTVIVFSGILYLVNPAKYPDPLFHVLAGGLMLGAFFMATDMVTSPVTKRGRMIFGIGAGIIVVVIRTYGGLPEAVMYSILFMNAFTPLLDRYTAPKVFGYVKPE